MPRPRRAIGYARVSSALQAQGTSLGDQQEAIAAYAKTRGLTVDRFYVEAESAVHEKFESREQIQALMRDVRAGDIVICAKLDRWSRDPEFTYGSVRKILAADASFYAVDDQCDPSTSEGDTMLGFRILFAREEHKRIRQRTVGTRNLLRDRGYYVEGRPPFGYRRSHPKGFKGLEKNVLVIVENEAELVRKMFALSIRGWSLSEIADELGLNRRRIGSSLNSRHYLGEIRNARHEWVKGLHPPIVTPDVFERSLRAIAERSLHRRSKSEVSETSTWVFRDILRCAHCGGKMGSAYAGKHEVNRRHYYRCLRQCRARGPQVTTRTFMPVGPLEGELSALVVARLVELRNDLGSGSEPTAARAPDFAAKREKLEKRRARHLEAHADGLMTLAELRAHLGKLDSQRQAIDAEESFFMRENALMRPEARRSALRELDTIQQAWRKAEPAIRREIVNRLLVEVRVANGVVPSPVWREVGSLVE